MDKTYNISLGGFAFMIDEVAYNILKKYLSDIKVSLRNSPGVDEIIYDVEYRMAELLREKMMGREVVNPSDVSYLVETMGQPEDFYNEEFLDDEPSTSSGGRTYTKSGIGVKKLFRDPDDKMLGGVCSGIAHYIGVDAVWVRLFLVLMPFLDFIFLGVSTGMLIFTYIILWLIIPLAKTTSDKLQMRGEPVNVDSIKDFFGNSPESIRENVKEFGNDARRVAQNSGSVIGDVLKLLVKIMAAIFIFFLFMIALTLLIAFMVAIFGIGIAGFSLNSYLPYLFEGSWEQIVAYISFALVMIIPAVVLVLIAVRLISSRYKVPRFIAFTLPILWILGVFGLIGVSVYTLTEFQRTSSITETVNIPTNANTIIVQRDDDYGDFDFDDTFQIKDGHFAVPVDDDLTLKKSTTGHAYVELKISGKGRTEARAANNLKGANYNYTVEDSLIRLDNFLFLKEGQRWRKQDVKTTLFLPEGKNVIFRNVDDVESYENGSYTWHDVDSENIYTFENNLLKCINCPGKTNLDKSNDLNSERELKIKSGEDSIIIKTNKNDTSNLIISSEADSIVD
ncbi:PspC domain-containing protein [Weeksellaceae bacterium KMM 9713]|uniref:PspC domain-containing protein n=1 Tax=Profundicola chukchiensis TaxID=2961959 RepID=A0A9X4N2V4_9FLAO|nr:PspC domain-containing protein [Profundicola chukchiensis]MDG4945924.1 PspC domain-containing protein [Profundicola chukchiensis]